MEKYIKIKNARVHNLKGIDIEIPKNKLTVITGVSGSGKSSLAFDTIYEEGKKRYLTFSGSQFMIESKETFDSITGLSPTVAVEQRVIRQSNPRSTVGTKIKIDTMLAALFANYGVCHSKYYDGTPMEIAMFQKNSMKGMCLKCLGTGTTLEIDEDEIFSDMNVTIANLFNGNQTHYCHIVYRLEKIYGIKSDRTLSSLSEDELLLFKYGDGGGNSGKTGFMGVIPWLKENYKYHKSRNRVNWVTKLNCVKMQKCKKCNGTGLGQEALNTTFAGKTISELEDMYIEDLYEFLKEQETSNNLLLKKIIIKLQCLMEVGLKHLSLLRKVPTLSGGEVQRLFLASYIMAGMDSIIFVFDEPTIGLHEIEKNNLINILKNLVLRGNTVIVVEHDENFIKEADYIVDIGPGAGIEGGERIYQGTFSSFLKCKDSKIAPYLCENSILPIKNTYRQFDPSKMLTISNANAHNLNNVNVSIPLGVMVGVAGVSGSGKSTLISDTLVPLIKNLINNRCIADEVEENEYGSASLSGIEHIDKCYLIDQRPIGRNRTSCLATYIGILDPIRKLFAKTIEAKEYGLKEAMFSKNSEGACAKCKGEGIIHHYVGYGNFIDVVCEECEGTGYKKETLDIVLDGKNIRDILNMSVSEAKEFFKEKDKGIYHILDILFKVGMGYIKLGQSTPTISGGEGQRIKLAKEMAKGRTKSKNYLYILDEPTTGLSLYDSEQLLKLMNGIVDTGNSMIVTEHDTFILSNCDYIIELGKCGGKYGGDIIAVGTPNELKNNSNSIIGRYLK